MSTVYKAKPGQSFGGGYLFGSPFDGRNDFQSWQWQRGVGESVESFIESGADKLLGIVDGLKEDYDSISIRPKGDRTGWYVLNCSQAGDDTTDVHEVNGSNLSQAKQFNLVFRAQLVALGVPSTYVDEGITKMVQSVNDYKALNSNTTADYEKMLSNVRESIGYTAAWTVSENFAKDLILNGETTLQSQFTYTHTIVIAERVFELNAGSYADMYDFTDQSFTEAQLRQVEGIPASFKMPQKVIDGTPAVWLKQPTHCRLTGGLRREITLSYLFADSWSSLYFKAYGTP